MLAPLLDLQRPVRDLPGDDLLLDLVTLGGRQLRLRWSRKVIHGDLVERERVRRPQGQILFGFDADRQLAPPHSMLAGKRFEPTKWPDYPRSPAASRAS